MLRTGIVTSGPVNQKRRLPARRLVASARSARRARFQMSEIGLALGFTLPSIDAKRQA